MTQMKRGNDMGAAERGAPMTTGASEASMASTAMKKADDMTESLGSGMKSLAGTLRQQAPTGGTMGQVAAGAAHALEQTGTYLQKEGVSGVLDDLHDMVRTYPLQSVLVCLGVGFLLAQITGRR